MILYFKVWMICEEFIQVQDVFTQVPDLVKDLLLYCYQAAILICYNSCTSRYIIYKRNLTKRITRIIVNLPFLFAFLKIFDFDTIDTFEYNEEMIAFIPFLKDNSIFSMHLHTNPFNNLCESRWFSIKRILNKCNFLWKYHIRLLWLHSRWNHDHMMKSSLYACLEYLWCSLISTRILISRVISSLLSRLKTSAAVAYIMYVGLYIEEFKYSSNLLSSISIPRSIYISKSISILFTILTYSPNYLFIY